LLIDVEGKMFLKDVEQDGNYYLHLPYSVRPWDISIRYKCNAGNTKIWGFVTRIENYTAVVNLSSLNISRAKIKVVENSTNRSIDGASVTLTCWDYERAVATFSKAVTNSSGEVEMMGVEDMCHINVYKPGYIPAVRRVEMQKEINITLSKVVRKYNLTIKVNITASNIFGGFIAVVSRGYLSVHEAEENKTLTIELPEGNYTVVAAYLTIGGPSEEQVAVSLNGNKTISVIVRENGVEVKNEG
jgi:hypothetical protein